MQPDPVGAIMAVIALVICCFGQQAAICAAFGCMVFGATELVSVQALGGASVTLPQFGLMLLLGVSLARASALERALRAVTEDTATRLLVGFAIIAVLGAVFLPRLVGWKVEVYSIDRFLADRTNQVPLVPSTGNISQSLYLLGGVAAFFAVIMIIRSEGDIRQFVIGLKTFIVLQAALALIDIVAKYGFFTDVLSFLRTAHYDMLTADDIAGAWRITGAYSEASFLATALAGQMAFCFAFWRSGQGGRFFPVMFGVLASVLALSTSSSAYVFLGVSGLWFMAQLVFQFAKGRLDPAVATLGLVLPLVVTVIAAGALLFGTVEMHLRAHQFVYQLLVDKMATVSGHERTAWNEAALTNVVETFGIGTGLGSTKTSSWPLALLSQTGLPGTALYGLYLLLLVAPNSWWSRPVLPRHAGLQQAGKAYIIGMILAASISWSYVDLGLPFNILAGLIVCIAHRAWYSTPALDRFAPCDGPAQPDRLHPAGMAAVRVDVPVRHPGARPP